MLPNNRGSAAAKILTVIACFAVLVTVVFLLQRVIRPYEPGLFNHDLFGKSAPVFMLPDINGELKNFKDYAYKKQTVLFFWTTWCMYCGEKLQRLQGEQSRLLANNGTVVVTLNLGEDASRVRRYLRERDIVLPVLLDQSGHVSRLYEVYGVPTFFIVNDEGILTHGAHDITPILDVINQHEALPAS